MRPNRSDAKTARSFKVENPIKDGAPISADSQIAAVMSRGFPFESFTVCFVILFRLFEWVVIKGFVNE